MIIMYDPQEITSIRCKAYIYTSFIMTHSHFFTYIQHSSSGVCLLLERFALVVAKQLSRVRKRLRGVILAELPIKLHLVGIQSS